MHQEQNPKKHLTIDSIREFRELTEIKLQSKQSGLLMIGGGVPKNFIQDTVVCAELLGKKVDMHKYAIQITVADTRDGACSSSTLKEASSWGKVDISKEQMVFAEATSVLPLIASDAFHRQNWKKETKENSLKFSNKMKFVRQRDGFLGYDANTNIKSKVVVVPFGLEKTVSYGQGTKNAPKEIIKASHQVELFDEELNKETYKHIGIKTLKPFKIKSQIKSALNQLAEINKDILSQKLFPLVLGGEHSITSGSIRPFVKKFDNLYILHFDAHADLREKYNGEKYSHATAIKRCLDFKNVKVVSFGIRNLSKEEMNFYNKNKKKIKIFWSIDKNKWSISKIRKLFKNKNVYITFDVDGFDSSLMPATGTPEPGGMFWNDVMPIIKSVCSVSNVVGADINELAPIKNFNSCNFLVAKLAYKIISYVFEFRSKY